MKYAILTCLAVSLSCFSYAQDQIEEAVLTSKQTMTSEDE